jgi:hypothetical protein
VVDTDEKPGCQRAQCLRGVVVERRATSGELDAVGGEAPSLSNAWVFPRSSIDQQASAYRLRLLRVS